MYRLDPKFRRLISIVQVVAIVISAALLAAAIVLLIIEPGWVQARTWNDREAFLAGPTGTDLLPLPVIQVLPEMYPQDFQPGGPQAGDWIDQFGFVRQSPDVNQGLPLGFYVAHYRPRSGGPSPVPFVGFTCGMCHTSLIRPADGRKPVLVEGMGTTSLDFLAWFDAFKDGLFDEKGFTVKSIDAAYRKKFGKPLTLTERLVIQAWLPGARKFFLDNVPKYDMPYAGADLRNSRDMPNGPSRTQPFRNLVRLVLDRPATLGDNAFCKIPSLYEQRNRSWGQYDGSVGNRLSRSVLAAIATGATLQNLVLPEISQSVTAAVNYTVDLKGPRYKDIFEKESEQLDPQRVADGEALYKQSCAGCHGWRNTGTGLWEKGVRTGQIVPIKEIKTDPERVTFRYYDTFIDSMYAYFPADYPLRPRREDLRPDNSPLGYINAPIESVFARTPYLHNGSVLTLAELINLKPRRSVFYRGANLYDPIDVGLVSPDHPTSADYYKFDTQVRGNSNAGHDYPWAYHGPGWDQHRLENLLQYLKTEW